MQWRTTASSPVHRPVPEAAQEEIVLSISDQRSLYLVNIFIAHTARFLNRFSALCEEKLADVHRRILRLDANLTLLEAKLRSINGLREVKEGGLEVEESSYKLVQQHHLSTQTFPEPFNGSGEPSSGFVDVHQETSMSSFKSEGLPVQPLTPVLLPTQDDDPRLSKFRRMLHFGVPEQAVKMQMSIEGMDPALLNHLGRR